MMHTSFVVKTRREWNFFAKTLRDAQKWKKKMEHMPPKKTNKKPQQTFPPFLNKNTNYEFDQLN